MNMTTVIRCLSVAAVVVMTGQTEIAVHMLN